MSIISKEDLLNREYEIKTICDIINARFEYNKGFSIAVNGDWGVGKSFLMEMVKDKIEAATSQNTNGIIFIKYDCWYYNYIENPIIAMATAIENDLKERKSIPSQAFDEYIESLKTLISGMSISLGVFSVELPDGKGKEIVDIITETRKALAELAKEKKIVICIDEIDRCLPEYQVKVLDCMHHIFNGLENVGVIVVMNKEALATTIDNLFSQKVDYYLKKLFDQTLNINSATTWGREGLISYTEDNIIDTKIVKRMINLLLHKSENIRDQKKKIDQINVNIKMYNNNLSGYSLIVALILLCYKDKCKNGPEEVLKNICAIYDALCADYFEIDLSRFGYLLEADCPYYYDENKGCIIIDKFDELMAMLLYIFVPTIELGDEVVHDLDFIKDTISEKSLDRYMEWIDENKEKYEDGIIFFQGLRDIM